MSPMSGMIRGTSRDRYSRDPSSKAFATGRKLCPRRNVQLLKATSAWPAANASAPAPDCRNVTSPHDVLDDVTRGPNIRGLVHTRLSDETLEGDPSAST